MRAESPEIVPVVAIPETVDAVARTETPVATPHSAPTAVEKRRPSRLRRWWLDNWQRYLVRMMSVMAALVLWKLAVAAQWHFIISFQNVPAPETVLREFIALLRSDVFYMHIGASVRRVAIAFSLASLLGIGVGVLMGCYKVAEDIVAPHIEILRPIPAVAWIPLAILMLPTEESSIIFITFLGALFPIVINTVHGVEQTPAVLLRAARSLGAGPRAMLRHVVLPSSLPSIVTGLAVGMGVSWFSLLAGEIISGQYGIGYFTWSAYTLVEYPKIIVGMLMIGGLGACSTALVKIVTRPLLRWQSDRGAKS